MSKNAALEKAIDLIADRGYRFSFMLSHGFYKNWSDERILKRLYKLKLHKELDLENPKTYNEKLQWLKIHDRNPEYSRMVDKIEAKNFIAEKVGYEYIIPTIDVWEKFDDIDFDKLPNQFVLKCNHDSGGLFIVRDKVNFNKAAARRKINRCLKRNFYLPGREWPYKNVKPRILAEKYMTDDNDKTGDPATTDYKFFCFNGEPKIMYISKDKSNDPRTDFFDMDFNHLPIKIKDPNADVPPQKPKQFELMRELAGKLSSGIPHLRVDFYIFNDRVYVGELTFYHNSGFSLLTPPEWNKQCGDWIDITALKNGKK